MKAEFSLVSLVSLLRQPLLLARHNFECVMRDGRLENAWPNMLTLKDVNLLL